MELRDLAMVLVNTMRDKGVKVFNSHDLIELMKKQYLPDYELLLDKYKNNQGVTHSVIANHLRYNALRLRIERDERKVATPNVNGNKTPCRMWRINK